MGERIAYLRTSTRDQHLERQEVIAERFKADKVFIDKGLSGKNTDRPELQRMLDYIRDNDVVVVESFSRLARSTVDFS